MCVKISKYVPFEQLKEVQGGNGGIAWKKQKNEIFSSQENGEKGQDEDLQGKFLKFE